MDPDPESNYLFQIILLLVLIIINAFFAMAEMATVSANRNTIRTKAADGKKSAVLLLGLIEKPNKFLSTIQVCITLAGFLQSAVAATAMADDLGSFFDRVFKIESGNGIAVVVITFILSFFNLVLGELTPKRIGLQYSDKIALITAYPVWFVSKIAAPFVFLLSATVSLILRLFGINKETIDEIYSEEEIKSHLDVGIETGLIDETGKEMISSVFEFDDKLAYEIMTPRTDVFMLSINDKVEEYVDELLKSRFSRIPFYNKDSDDIVGVLYMKDYIIQAKNVGFNRVNVQKLLQKPFFVPETKNINELFNEMQEKKKHLAFLIDEYGGVSGIVTTEDIVEEIMGAIDDEYDDAEPKMDKLDDGSYVIDGNYYLDDLNDELSINLQSDDYETIGGFLMNEIGEIPDEDSSEQQVVKIEKLKFTIESWKDRRIDRVVLEINNDEEQTSEEESA